MIVIIAEKPSVAQSIASILGATEKKDGFIQGSGYQVTWAFGHLVTLAVPEYYGFPKPWDINKLPVIPSTVKLVLKDDPGAKKQFKIIKDLFLSADELIVATDAGREGELIFRYIYILSGCRKPFKRLWISSLTNEAIKTGFINLKPGASYDNLYQAARARSEADWLIGMNATMALTLSANQGKMTIGRVQTPTLALIASAFLANKNFQPKSYVSLSVLLTKNETDFKAIYSIKIKSKEEASEIIQDITDRLSCTDKEVREVVENAPLLYDLSSLQQDAFEKNGFKTQKTLDIMQALYEKHKALSYPRTNSRYLSDDMKEEVKNLFTRLATSESGSIKESASKLANSELSLRPFNNEKITDHHAIILTITVSNQGLFSPDEQVIFNLVKIRFIQAFMPAAKKLKTTLSFALGNGAFEAKGSQILVPGFLAVETKIIDAENEDEVGDQVLPALEKGELIFVKRKATEEKLTKAPKLLNEASLLRLMETAGRLVKDANFKEALKDIGIGTAVTRSVIIERLFEVLYIINKGKYLIPTEKGLAVYEIIKDKEIGSPELTGQWEQKLNLIADGKYSVAQFDKEIKEYTNSIVNQLKIVGKELVVAAPAGAIICPQCKKGSIKETPKAWGCSAYKEGCSFTIWKVAFGKTITAKIAEQLIKKGATSELKFKSKLGKEYGATLKLDGEFKIKMVFSEAK